MITHHNGDLLTSGADYICHQVNCRGAMNSGVAKAIREKYPIVFEKYSNSGKKIINDCGDHCLSWEHMLGKAQFVYCDDRTFVVNMFAQKGYGYDGRRYTSYDAFWNALNEIKVYLEEHKTWYSPRIAFPYGIGCVRGGANWNVILMMIAQVLGDYDVEIWRLDNG